MNARSIFLLFIFHGMLAGTAFSINSSHKDMIWFGKPAALWEETFPLGNGRLGIMPDGGIERERIVLNEITMWSGSEANYNNPEAATYLPRIRKLLLSGRNKEAQEIMYKHFVPEKPEKGGTYGCYQMLANLDIEYRYQQEFQPVSYNRILNLSDAVATTHIAGAHPEYTYERDYFASRTEDVIVIRISSRSKKGISFAATLNRPERATTKSLGNKLILEGNLDSGKENQTGVSFIAEMSIKTLNGKVHVTDNSIEVDCADEATIYISAGTDYKNPGYKEEVSRLLESAMNYSADELKNRHKKKHYELYGRTSLNIYGSETSPENLPIDERIKQFQQKDDPLLPAIYFNYGKYLLISSTRPGSLPPNLQGLWANTCSTPWNGDYHLNINVQMNHWPVEPANLSELHLPLIELTKELVESGESTAKAFYGHKAKGWVAHMMTNAWNFTAPGEHPSWGATNTGGAWLCAHLWEHYLFTRDKEYLAEIYPVLKGAADFFLSTMIEEPAHGWLVTAPTSSPENEFYIGNDNTPISICMGPTMDTQLIRELYTNLIEAARILDIDSAYSKQLTAACKKLPPHQVSKDGYLMEWLEDYREADIHHRHVSHLYGLHPGNQITPAKTPELAEACRVTLNRRGDGGTGWSRAWKINFWARLGDGNRAYTLFRNLLLPAYEEDTPDERRGGTFPNLFCSHPPFQIDGNWGGMSGVIEMLLQSHDGYINIIPAIPDSWKKGSFSGFKVRGGATIDVTWKEQEIDARITADIPNSFQIKVPKGKSVAEVYQKGKSTLYHNKSHIELILQEDEGVEVRFR